VRVAFSRSVPIIPGVQVYNTSWKPPGRSFTGFDSYLELNFTGCDFNVSWLLDDGSANFMCNVTCPSEGIMDEAIARQQCNGTGCCSYYQFLFGSHDAVSSLNLQFVRNDPKANAKQPNRRSSLWDRINVESDYGMWLSWVVADEPNCAAASANKTKYACVSKHSTCIDKLPSYICMCEPGYSGNPYVADGCLRDRGNIYII
jgi:hypothetical protein